MKEKLLEIGSHSIAYYESTGKGIPVIFIHGNSCSSKTFEKQFDSFLGSEYRLIALDLPGHGKSKSDSTNKSVYTLPGYASVIKQFVNRLSIEDAFYVGWSLGGHILMEASTILSNASGLAIYGAPPVGIPPRMLEAFMHHPATACFFKGDLGEEEIDLWASSFFAPNSAFDLNVIKEDIKHTKKEAREEMGASVSSLKYSDEIKIIEKLKIPLAIFQGDKDQLVNLHYINSLNIPSLWKNKVCLIPESGHAPHIEQSDKFNELLKEFITETIESS